MAELQHLAESLGVPASTSVRSWIVQRTAEPRSGSAQVDPAVRAAVHAEVRADAQEALADAAYLNDELVDHELPGREVAEAVAALPSIPN